MKHQWKWLGLCCTLLATSPILAEEATESPSAEIEQPSEQSDVVRLSEAFGHLIGQNLDNPGIKFDLESIVKGMRDAANGLDSPMTEQEYEETIAAIQEKAFNDLAQRNLKEANSFLEANAIAEGVVEVDPGKLQYKVIAAGVGNEVGNSSTPTIHYTGTYIDGSLFGSSEDTGGPVTLPLDQTLPGFKEGIVGMKEGEKRRIYIHPELGYGTAGHLPPNSLLVFDVEVITAGNHDQAVAIEEAQIESSHEEAIAEVEVESEGTESVE